MGDLRAHLGVQHALLELFTLLQLLHVILYTCIYKMATTALLYVGVGLFTSCSTHALCFNRQSWFPGLLARALLEHVVALVQPAHQRCLPKDSEG